VEKKIFQILKQVSGLTARWASKVNLWEIITRVGLLLTRCLPFPLVIAQPTTLLSCTDRRIHQ